MKEEKIILVVLGVVTLPRCLGTFGQGAQGSALSQGEHGRGNCKLHCGQEAKTEQGLGSQYTLQGSTSNFSRFLHPHPKVSPASNNTLLGV